MGFFANRRARRIEADSDFYNEVTARLSDPRNAVTMFKQRMAEDPDFKTDFVKAMFDAKAEADARGAALAAEYFKDDADATDPNLAKRRATYSLVAGRALADIIDTVAHVANCGDTSQEAAETFLHHIGETIMEVADEAYFAGSLALQNLRLGSFAVHDPEFGTLIAWERAKAAGMNPEQLDQFSYILRQLDGGSSES